MIFFVTSSQSVVFSVFESFFSVVLPALICHSNITEQIEDTSNNQGRSWWYNNIIA